MIATGSFFLSLLPELLYNILTPQWLIKMLGFLVVCAPYYVSQSDLGFYPQYPKVLLPGGIKRRPRTERIEKTKQHGGGGGGGGYEIMMQAGGNNEGLINSSSIDCNPETLALFPLHPTGDLQRRQPPTSAQNSTTFSTPSESDGSSDQHLFDFFPAPSSTETI